MGSVLGGGGVSLQLILITWPQAVRQMRDVGGGKLEGGEGRHEVDNSQHFARRQRFQGRQALACGKFLPPAKFLACAKFFGAYIFEYFSAFLLSMCQQLDWRKCLKIFRLRLIIVVMIMYCVS